MLGENLGSLLYGDVSMMYSQSIHSLLATDSIEQTRVRYITHSVFILYPTYFPYKQHATMGTITEAKHWNGQQN